MESVVEEVKKKIDIISFIGSVIPLKKTGRNYKGLCPFHQEKTPSFVVSPDRQIWHCFGACQEGGDVIKFMMKWENITFIEAIRDLAEKAGIKLKKFDYEDKVWKKRERLISINYLASEFFEHILNKTGFAQKARDYLKNRGIEPKVVKKFQLGYAPLSWDSLLNFLRKKKYDPREIYDTGLVVRGERGNLYDRFRGRLVFPIKDVRDNTVGFSGRMLEKDTKEAKYVNTPETLLYHKRETLYGLNLAKEAVRKEKNIILVEGEFDVISPYQQGIENIAAIKGSAVTKEQLMFLKRYTNRITLALDSDLAGEEAMKRGIEEAENLEFDIGIVTFDFAKDPDEAVRTDPVKFKAIIKKPIPFYDFIINYSQKKNPDNDAFSKKKIADESVVFLEKIKNPIVQSHYIKKLAAILDVSEASIDRLIRQKRIKKKQQSMYLPKTHKNIDSIRVNIIQKYLLSVIFQSDDPQSLSDKIFKTIGVEDFSLPAYRKICQAFFKYMESKKTFKLDDFVKRLPAELRPVFDEVYLYASTELPSINENLEKLVCETKRYSLKRKLTQLLSLEDEENGKIKEDLKRITQELGKIERIITASQ